MAKNNTVLRRTEEVFFEDRKKNELVIIPHSAEERAEVEALLERLSRASLRVIHRNGQKATLMILQGWKSNPKKITANFTPGVIDVLGRDLEPKDIILMALEKAT
ncbi:hypothetical protein IQ22_04496 [Pseudomonas duriflava]|uniref:Uncharacterized protein n=1 Tax=Pseudomonas duriflava TaxID=459528 RepID=A0A562PQG5_9PSED|nr:hypothetical protein [Pseudomonas duriflava]TWI46306.1 hypothetical protein IQ22_04496 [Pseudomonas duriflava]